METLIIFILALIVGNIVTEIWMPCKKNWMRCCGRIWIEIATVSIFYAMLVALRVAFNIHSLLEICA